MTTPTETSPDVTKAIAAFRQWAFLVPNGTKVPMRPKSAFDGPADRNYNLFNHNARHYLQWEDQTWGINLGWTDDTSHATATRVRRWFIDNPGPDLGNVRYGDLVALGNGKAPSFLHYAKRTVGINLDWSTAPRHEWRVLGGRIGTTVHTTDRVALFNEDADEFLIYFDRSLGGDIGWPSSKTFTDQIAGGINAALQDAVKKAFLKGLSS